MTLEMSLARISLFWVTTFSGLIATRVFARLLTRFFRRRGRNLRNVLIIGTNSRAVSLADHLIRQVDFGFRVVGFVDDTWHHKGAPECYKDMLIGSTENFLDLLRELQIDEVVMALPIASQYWLTRQIVNSCLQQGVPVRSEANLFDISQSSLRDPDVPPELITHHERLHSEYKVITKRLFDLVFSATLIVILLPLLAIIGVLIRISSPGPILFAQERLGLYKRRFRIWKFRTMVPGAEALMKQLENLNETKGPTFKLKRDPRVTKIGVFLRKTSLDELPQLFNVFLGDMSLVGPRPLPMRDYKGFTLDSHRRRFSVKPGITCLWQVNGRSSISFDQWMELDMDYIDRWSLRLDLEILLKTIPAVIRGSGAI